MAFRTLLLSSNLLLPSNLLLSSTFYLLTSTLSVSCRSENPPSPPKASEAPSNSDTPWFVERAAETGLAFTHLNGMTGKFYYGEIIGSGAAVFDYDNDGDLDVFLVQGGSLEGEPRSPGGRLFRNDLTINADGTRTLRFTDVTGQSGISTKGYGMGAAAADYDNDGCVDLYVTNLGRNELWRNNCDGTFREVTAGAFGGRLDSGWSVSAAFFDFDRDGWLDLFVGHYLTYSVRANMPCFSPSGRPDYCSPNVYSPEPSRLYHNNRNGTFTDVTAAAGMARDVGPSLGVATADFNGDGWPDVYVANDGQPNQLWINQHDGMFKNTGLLSGTAMSAHGRAKAGMGVDAGDFDNDGDEDLVVANLRGEGSDLYVNDGTAVFEEQGARAGLGGSQPYTGFGAAWLDVDNDGWLDVLIVNGAVQTLEALRQAGDPFPLHQPKLLFQNDGRGRFQEATARGGAALRLSDVSRGAAFGDLDNDGSIDVVIANNNGPARLLINTIGHRNHWVGLRLAGDVGRTPQAAGGSRQADAGTVRRRDLLGARAVVTREDGKALLRRARSDGSYASANDPRVIVGLGSSASKPVRVQVAWPDGKVEQWGAVAIDRYSTLVEGSSK